MKVMYNDILNRIFIRSSEYVVVKDATTHILAENGIWYKYPHIHVIGNL